MEKTFPFVNKISEVQMLKTNFDSTFLEPNPYLKNCVFFYHKSINHSKYHFSKILSKTQKRTFSKKSKSQEHF